MFQHLEAVVKLLLALIWSNFMAFIRLFIRPAKVSVADKVIVITGGGSGLGRELAVRLAAEGARIVLWDINDNGNKGTAARIRAATPDAEVHLYNVNVTKTDVVRATALKVQSEVGPVYMLINNAGILVGETILELKEEEIRRTIDINLVALFWTLRAFLPAMLEANSGHIVTTCSTAGQNGMHRMSDYCASKFAVMGMDECLESEIREIFKKDGVKQTLVCPHILNTGLIHSVEQRVYGMNDVNEAADHIVDGVLRQNRFVFFPEIFRYASALKGLVPHECHMAMKDFMQTKVSSQKVNKPHRE